MFFKPLMVRHWSSQVLYCKQINKGEFKKKNQDLELIGCQLASMLLHSFPGVAANTALLKLQL